MARREKTAKADAWVFKVALGTTIGGLVANVVGSIVESGTLRGLGFAMLFVGMIATFKSYGDKRRTTKAAAEYRAQLDQFNAFMANPDGGGFLGSVASKHPQLAA